MTILEQVVAALVAAHIDHAMIGAGALAVHGVARSTFDLDLMTTSGKVLDSEAWSSLERAGASIDLRGGTADDPVAGIVRIARADERPVDLLVGRHVWDRRAIERAAPTPFGAATIPVVLVNDLVLLKLYAAGHQDHWDVEQLVAGDPAAPWLDEVDRDVLELPRECAERWRTIRSRFAR